MSLITARGIQFKRADSVRWSQQNPILKNGEPGFEEDTGRFKIGNGITEWNQLGYIGDTYVDPGSGVTHQELLDHINAEEPHPDYDDGSSFILRYQNAKV